MERLTNTPFGARMVSYAEFQAAKRLTRAKLTPVEDKWALLRDLTVGRGAFEVTDRDLAVLNALVSFLPGVEMVPDNGLIVFPSNRALCERAHGMAESTLRRHIAALVRAGLIQRHDSPNGKRYAVRGQGGTPDRAFGFDLTPLVARSAEIAESAADARTAAFRLKAARERASLHLRDVEGYVALLAEAGRDKEGLLIARSATFRRRWRRRLDLDELMALSAELAAFLGELSHSFDAYETKEMSGNDVGYERHYHNSKTQLIESELCLEKQKGKVRDRSAGSDRCQKQAETGRASRESAVSLGLVKFACKEITLYADGDIKDWRDLHRAAGFVRGMMGISPDAWDDAEREMGLEVAAVVIAAMLERMSAIHSPGGYLRALTEKARAGAFSPGPMVMALVNTREKAVG